MIQVPLHELVDNTDNIESLSINIASNNGMLGTIVASIGLSTLTANGGWYQKDFNLNLNDDNHTIEIQIDNNIDMNIKHGILQIGYWYGQQQAITLKNITIYYSDTAAETPANTTEFEETTFGSETEVTTEISEETTTITETEDSVETTTEETTETTTESNTEDLPPETTVDIKEATNWSINILLNKPNQDVLSHSIDFNKDNVINVFDLIHLKKQRLGL